MADTDPDDGGRGPSKQRSLARQPYAGTTPSGLTAGRCGEAGQKNMSWAAAPARDRGVTRVGERGKSGGGALRLLRGTGEEATKASSEAGKIRSDSAIFL